MRLTVLHGPAYPRWTVPRVRQPARRLQHTRFEQRRERDRIGQAHLAGKQPAADLQAVLGQHVAEEGMHRHQATQVHRVLGEGQAATGRHAAEHALCRSEAFFGVLPGIAEVAEHFDEIGAFACHGNRFGTQADALQTLDVDAASDLLGKRRQPFLGRSHPRRGQRQAGQHRLFAAIQGGQRMHQRFVVEQLRAVVGTEARTGAQADAGRSGSGLGHQLRIELHLDDARFEEGVQIVLQLQLQGNGRDRHLLFRRQ